MVHFFSILNVTLGVWLRLCAHAYIDSVVSWLYFWCLKLFVWFLNCSLNFVVVHPMYSAVLLSCVMVALYITFFVRHDVFGVGHVLVRWQLHGLVSVCCSLS